MYSDVAAGAHASTVRNNRNPFPARRDVPPVDAEAIGAVVVADTGIVAVSVSPDCTIVAVQHTHDVVFYSTASLVEQRSTEPLWSWQLEGSASIRQACCFPTSYGPYTHGHLQDKRRLC